MRISEERYTRDRRVLDVAVRMIEFEARTGTIRRLTGLADGRIRALSKACGIGSTSNRKRHRGASPHCVNTFLRNDRSRSEAATLLGLCQLMGVRPPAAPEPERATHRLTRAERLCDVYWTFRILLPDASISFEHLLLLLTEVHKAEELTSTCCRSCSALLVVDIPSLYGSLCPHCADHAPWRRSEPVMQYACVAEDSAGYR